MVYLSAQGTPTPQVPPRVSIQVAHTDPILCGGDSPLGVVLCGFVGQPIWELDTGHIEHMEGLGAVGGHDFPLAPELDHQVAAQGWCQQA